jgi:putative addiction module component (TIGR02574 family)
VRHTSIPEPPGFSELSKAEQIRYVQALWERIADSEAQIPVPESHLSLAQQRLADYHRDPTQARPAHDVPEHLAQQTQ